MKINKFWVIYLFVIIGISIVSMAIYTWHITTPKIISPEEEVTLISHPKPIYNVNISFHEPIGKIDWNNSTSGYLIEMASLITKMAFTNESMNETLAKECVILNYLNNSIGGCLK